MMTTHRSTAMIRSMRGSVRIRPGSHPDPYTARPGCDGRRHAAAHRARARPAARPAGAVPGLRAGCLVEEPGARPRARRLGDRARARVAGDGRGRARAGRARRGRGRAARGRPDGALDEQRAPGDAAGARAVGLAPLLDLVVTRDDMTALKPDPDGWRIIAEHFAVRPGGQPASPRSAAPHGDTRDAVVVGDSWVDGVAAAAVGVPFVAYGAREADLTRHGVTPVAWLSDLARLPEWLTTHFGFQGSPRRSNRLGSHCHDGHGRT